MIFDSYRHFLETPTYNKIVGDDFLIVEFKCPIDEELFHAWAECHSIIYVLDGSKKWITHEEEWLVKKGESVFVKKGAFLNQQDVEEGFCLLMFFMNDAFIKSCVENDLEVNPISLSNYEFKPIHRINITGSLESVYNSFFSYLKQGDEVPDKIIELKFREMLVNILSDPKNNRLQEFVLDLAANEGGSLQKIMEKQFMFNLKVEEYARLCGKSLSSFKREFQKVYETTPRRWLTSRRLKYARELLMKTSDTVQEICFESGFENDSHFSRVFKETYGLTPMQFRKSSKSDLLGVR